MSYEVTQTHGNLSPQTVTITHPHHPLKGQQVAILRRRNGADPDLIVRLPDGTHTAIAMSATDFVATQPLHEATQVALLLDPKRLYQLSLFVQRLLDRQKEALSSSEAEGSVSPSDATMR